jgi:hypothetical protein
MESLHDEMRIFAGNSNLPLARDICSGLELPLGEALVETFSDGEIRVEIIGADHHPIEGYGFKDADPITTTGLAHVVSWNGKSDLSSLKDIPVKLRIHFKNAKLYSFQFK